MEIWLCPRNAPLELHSHTIFPIFNFVFVYVSWTDPEMLALVQEWKFKVSNFSDEVIAKSHVFLDGQRDSCRLRECNLGNLIADAYLWSLITFPDEEGWNEVSIAVQNGGGIRASILRGRVF